MHASIVPVYKSWHDNVSIILKIDVELFIYCL
jgi:hypothetical protein